MRATAGRKAGAGVQMMQIGGRVLRVAVRQAPHPDQSMDTPPLLLCNGIGGSLELLQPFVDALDPRREVIRFDLPGIGGSPAPAAPYHLLTLPPLVTGLLDQLGHPRADVLGISWGGGLAQQLAFAHPRRIRRLVLVATGTGSLMVPPRPGVLRHLLTPQRHRDPGCAARIAGAIYGGTLRGNPDRARELLHATAPQGPRRGYYYQLLAGAGWTSVPLLPRLRQPVLLLAGDDDPMIRVINARLMRAITPRAQLRIYPGGHLELIASPSLLAPAIEAFLDRDEGSPHADR
jgi:poly(3-hydroxyalkanoate) depolymerase